MVLLSRLACSAPPPLHADGAQGGRIVVTPLKSYIPLQSNVLPALAGVKGISAVDAIDCYRIVYPSTDAQGRPIAPSGPLALPRGAPAKGLVSFQHGTTSDRTFVPSNLSADGLAAAIVFAGNGYAAIAPDYQGLAFRPGRTPISSPPTRRGRWST